jgi:alcohol dehydrogenase
MDDIISVEGVKKTIFGRGSIKEIGPECKRLGISKALLVIDNSLANTDLGDRVMDILMKNRVKSYMFSDISPEPEPAQADKGAEYAKKEKVRGIIGVGGGSTMDVAKAISVLVTNEGKAVDYIGLNLVKKAGLPTIMIPTTAGTGSENTFTSVFTMRETKSKGGINSPYLFPHTAVIDPELTIGLPPYISAYTGMDALTHAIESFTSVQAHFLSEPISLKAIELISKNLRGAVYNGNNIEFRTRMLEGSYLAGLGLAMSGVTAVHALAYPLGSFFDIPHGIANALLLPYVLEYNYPGDIDKFSLIASTMGHAISGLSSREAASLASEAVYDLADDIGIPLSLKALGIPSDSIPEMAKAAMNVERPIRNNPRPVTLEVAEEIYWQAFEE